MENRIITIETIDMLDQKRMFNWPGNTPSKIESIIVDEICYRRIVYKNGDINWCITNGNDWIAIWDKRDLEKKYKNIKRSQKLERILDGK